MHPRPNRVPSKLRGRAKNNAELRRTGRVHPAVPPSHRITNKREMRALGVHQLTGRDADGRTVLHILARKGKKSLSLAVLRHLPPSIRTEFLNARTNATAPGCGHRTALHIAALYGHGKLYFELLRAGADPTLRDRKGRTARAIRRIMVVSGCSSIGVSEAGVATQSS